MAYKEVRRQVSDEDEHFTALRSRELAKSFYQFFKDKQLKLVKEQWTVINFEHYIRNII